MKIHIIAIGGAAMHNLAIALSQKGHQVSGSDDEIFEPSRSRLKTHNLLPEQWGWYPDKIDQNLDAIIIGMHARKDNPELEKAINLGIKIYSYPEFLYEQTRNKKRLVIAGSHGKTSITSMVLHVLKSCGKDFDYMVGAQIDGFDTMVGLSEKTDIAIFEGDEYLSSPIDLRSKFLWYKPHAAVITGIAWDHANVFPNEDNYIDQFREFIRSIQAEGKLAWFAGDKKLESISQENPAINSFAYDAIDYHYENQKCILKTPIGEITLSIFGKHNIQNLEAARFLCNEAGISDADFYHHITSFKGAARRLQLLAKNENTQVFLDFAHAPSKVKATTAAMKEMNPNRRLIAVLELHTFSSLNKTFIPQYFGSLDDADDRLVYFNPEVVKHKQLPTLSPEFVKTAFGNTINVYTDSNQLKQDIKLKMQQGGNLLIMTSGNFDGQNMIQLANEIVV
jgi:UDP-N-acetylmuramate: L-alanyl-gamma-D-glutamyl-meso-diaminopimelate ligase